MKNVSLTLLALLLLVSFCSQVQAEITKGPYLLMVGDRSIVVKWESDETPGWVDYGLKPGDYQFRTQSSFSGGMHEAKLFCILPETRYYYRVVAGGSQSGEHTFSTGAGPDTPFSFVVFGDNRTNDDDHLAVVQAIAQNEFDFTINTGDLVELGILPLYWDIFFATEEELMFAHPYFACMGNHELGGKNNFRYYLGTSDNWDEPSRFAFTYGNSRFIMLDISEPYGPASAQRAWLEAELAASANKPRIKHIFVVVHYPPYSAGHHGGDGVVLALRESLVPLFEQYGVDMVFSGHDHSYEHAEVNDIIYIVSGGGGAPLYGVGTDWWTVYSESALHYLVIDVDGEHVSSVAYRLDGSAMDDFDYRYDIGGDGIPGTDDPDPCYDFDYDGDGLTDGYEQYESDCLDPFDPDTDGDGYSDGDEVEAGTDPCDPNSHPEEPDDDDDTDDDTGDDDSGGGCGC